MMALDQLDVIERAEVVRVPGPPDTGSEVLCAIGPSAAPNHLAVTPGVAAVKAGRSVYRCTPAELIDARSRAEREGRLVEKIRFHSRASLLIIPERVRTNAPISLPPPKKTSRQAAEK